MRLLLFAYIPLKRFRLPSQRQVNRGTPKNIEVKTADGFGVRNRLVVTAGTLDVVIEIHDCDGDLVGIAEHQEDGEDGGNGPSEA